MIARWFSGQGRGALAAVLVSLAGAGFSAHAGHADSSIAIALPSRAVGFDAQDHFPGAALLYADTQAGGTDSDQSIHPAAPFVLRGSELDKARALLCLTSAIYYEAASEPDDGQAAVAQVVLNRVRHPMFPGTVCGVVYQGSDTQRCQFSFACDGATVRVAAKSAWERSRRVAARALGGFVFAPVGLATHYHTYAVAPAWNRSLVMTGVFGAHFFHRWQGAQGTPAAFTQTYRGGEPSPGPNVHTAMLPATPIAAVVAAPPARPKLVDTATSQDRYTARTDESQILDKWKDSGQPLR